MIGIGRRVLISLMLILLVASSAAAQKKKVTITSIEPEGAVPGTRILIKGENFAAEITDNRVFVGNKRMKVLAVFPSYIQAVVPNGARSGPIRVETKQYGRAQSPMPFTVMIPLTVKSVSHKYGPPGSQITITGTGFSKKAEDNSVTLGVMRCKVTKVTPTQLTVVIPDKAKTGPFTVQVKGSGKVKTKGQFLVARTPVISKFSPSSGRPGSKVTLTGNYFGTDPSKVEVRLAAAPCKVLSVSDKELVVQLPKNAQSGAFQLAVNRMKSSPSSTVFEVELPLKATNMKPTQAPRGGEVWVYGTGFSSNLKDNHLLIGAITTKAIRLEKGAVVFRIPKNAAGGSNGVQLNVKNRGKIDIPVPLIVTEPVAVHSFNPVKGSPNSQITIQGAGFGTAANDVRVSIGGQFAKIQSVTPNTIVAIVPPGASSSKITVQTRTNGTAYSKKGFTVLSPVIIANFSPTGGGPNQQVRLYGQGFDPQPAKNKVTLNGKNLKVLQASGSSLLVQIPEGASSGRFRVRVGNSGEGESQGTFTYAAPVKPAPAAAAKLAISSIKPTTGPVGTYVTITGSGFTQTGMRAFVGRAPAGMRVYSPTQAMIAIPNNATTGAITLTQANGQQASSRESFQIQSQMSVNKFYPMTGPPGTRVTIYGTDFQPGKTQVYLGTRQLRVEPNATSQMLVVNIPPGAQSGMFSVRSGGKTANSVGAFRVVPPKTVVSTQPTQPKNEPIFSSSDDGKSAIETLMEEKPKESPKVQQKGKEPPPSIDALLGFESQDGEAFKIDSIEPKEGPVGETVMVNGSGFGDDPSKVKAWLGTAKAKVVGVVPDMIMIEVPSGVKSGKVKLRIEGKPALTSKQDFIVTK